LVDSRFLKQSSKPFQKFKAVVRAREDSEKSSRSSRTAFAVILQIILHCLRERYVSRVEGVDLIAVGSIPVVFPNRVPTAKQLLPQQTLESP
jgi:hypothetical protein